MTERRFFGTDGIRGRMGEAPITPEFVLKLGWAAGRVLSRNRNHPTVLIGKDTRVSGYLLESALEAGFSAAGVNIRLLGPMPTPGIAYLTRTARATAGIVISASHNHYEDNGIKFFSPSGTKLEDRIELEIERTIDEPLVTVCSGELGKAERFPDAAGRYIEFCKSAVPHRLTLKNIKMVVDCANGAAYHIAPNVFAELGAQVVTIGDKPDGFNINRDCGSTSVEALQDAVVANGAQLGVALDGDGDRVIMVDESGARVDGDQVLYILASDRQRRGTLDGGVVGTLMSNLGLEQALDRLRIPFARAQVGDRYVMNVLLQRGWTLGGEASGHVICLDKSSTGDGIIAALQVLQAMVEQEQSLAGLKAAMPVYPQTIINVPLPGQGMVRRLDLDNNAVVADALRQAQSELGDSGRVVLRSSGTEPVIRVMVEGDDSTRVDRIGDDLARAVKTAAAEDGAVNLATA